MMPLLANRLSNCQPRFAAVVNLSKWKESRRKPQTLKAVQRQNKWQILATHQTGYFCNVSMTEQYLQSCAAKTRNETSVQKSEMDSVIRKA